MPESLLPCPCCGGKADSRGTDVFCTQCGLRTGMRFRLYMSVKIWNRRIEQKENKPEQADAVRCDAGEPGA